MTWSIDKNGPREQVLTELRQLEAPANLREDEGRQFNRARETAIADLEDTDRVNARVHATGFTAGDAASATITLDITTSGIPAPEDPPPEPTTEVA